MNSPIPFTGETGTARAATVLRRPHRRRQGSPCETRRRR